MFPLFFIPFIFFIFRTTGAFQSTAYVKPSLLNHYQDCANSPITFYHYHYTNRQHHRCKFQSMQLSKKNQDIDQDLIRPPINIRKESLLFSDNPSTAKNNNIARLWKILRNNLPYVMTGVSSSKSDEHDFTDGTDGTDGIGTSTSDFVDDNPIGAIYNIIFVRLPTILASLVYTKNLIERHPLYIDLGFGGGAFEIPPLFVYGVLIIILR